MPLHQLAEFFPILILHVHEFNAGTVVADIADHRRKVDFFQTRADLQANGIAYVHFLGRFQVRAAQADGLDARNPRLPDIDLRAQRGF